MPNSSPSKSGAQRNMAFALNGTNRFLTATTPITAVPITVSCWFLANNNTANMALVVLENNSGTHRFDLQALGATTGDPIQSGTASGGPSSFARTTTGFSANTWNHACGVFSTINSRTAYLNAGAKANNTGSQIPNGISVLKIGALNLSGTNVSFFNGSVAEVGIWNASLTDAEIESLAKGMTCDKIRPQNLVFYAPLVRDLIDQKGGLALTDNNGATVANHPRVYA
jgi:hypothetical protein